MWDPSWRFTRWATPLSFCESSAAQLKEYLCYILWRYSNVIYAAMLWEAEGPFVTLRTRMPACCKPGSYSCPFSLSFYLLVFLPIFLSFCASLPCCYFRVSSISPASIFFFYWLRFLTFLGSYYKYLLFHTQSLAQSLTQNKNFMDYRTKEYISSLVEKTNSCSGSTLNM